MNSEAVSASACYFFLLLMRAVFIHRKDVEVP